MAAPKITTVPGTTQVALHVHLTEGASLRGRSSATKCRAQDDDVTAEMLATLSPELRGKLIELEPRVLRWIRSSKENAARFVVDPLGALREAVPGIDQKTLAALAAIRAKHAKQKNELAGIDLVSVTLDAEPAEEPGRKRS